MHMPRQLAHRLLRVLLPLPPISQQKHWITGTHYLIGFILVLTSSPHAYMVSALPNELSFQPKNIHSYIYEPVCFNVSQ